MFQMQGRYNHANVMLPDKSYLDDVTKDQIQNFLNHPAFNDSLISIMPDTHKGVGTVIGFTMSMNDYIIPNIVGVDIGCGVLTVNLGKHHINLEKFDNYIRNNIFYGMNVNKERYDRYCTNQLLNDIINISSKIDSNGDRNLLSICSLGSGNHFIELGKDESGDVYLTVHSGSRKFGLDIANYHQKKAKMFLKKFFVDEKLFKDLEFLPMEYGGCEYLEDMSVAQEFASVNRKSIVTKILQEELNIDFEDCESIESIHNYIDVENEIIRKGAIESISDKKLVIPFNMEDGLIIGTGKSNSLWNNSAPHGAGRIYSRKKAKEVLNIEEAKKSMDEAGIYTTSLTSKTLDEAKGAYKPKELILESIKDSVDVVNFVKPIYNFKAEE